MPTPITPYSGEVPNPLLQDQPEFDQNSQDAWEYLLNFLGVEINQFVADLGTGNTNSTSVTSNTIGTGSKAFTVEIDKSYFFGQSVTIARTAEPTNRMFAVVDSYDSGTGALVVTSQASEGSGTFTDWTITLGFNGIVSESQLSTSAQNSLKASIVGDSKNLIIQNNSGTPNSQVDIDADEIILKDSSGRAFLAEAVNLTLDITVTGINGLDAGTEANSTWYYIWLESDGTTLRGKLSTSSSSPTLSSGYTYKALLGAIYNGSGGNFNLIRQVGNQVFISRTTISTSVPGTTYASISLATIVPPNAKSALIQRSDQLGASANVSLLTSPQDGDDFAYTITAESGGGTSYRNNAIFELSLREVQTIYQKRSGTAPSSTALYCTGWRY